MEKIRFPEIKTIDREIRIEYSDERRKYVYKDFARIIYETDHRRNQIDTDTRESNRV